MWIMGNLHHVDCVDYGYTGLWVSGLWIHWIMGTLEHVDYDVSIYYGYFGPCGYVDCVAPQNALAFIPCWLITSSILNQFQKFWSH